MNKQMLTLFCLSLIGSGVGYALSSSYSLGLCYSDVATNTFDVACHAQHEAIGNPIYYGFSALAVVFFMLLFVPQAVKTWRKFAVWFVPLATLLFAFYPDPSSGDLFSPYPEQVFQWVSAFYVVVSLVIIAITSARSTHTHPTP